MAATAVTGQAALATRILSAEARGLRDVAAWNEVTGTPALDPATLRHVAARLDILATLPNPLRSLASEQAGRTAERRRWRAGLRAAEGIE